MANWTAVWQTATGALYSVGTVIATPLPSGFSSTDTGLPPTGPPPSGIWNTTTHVFDPAPAQHSILSGQGFLDRWTQAERQAWHCFIITGLTTPPGTPVAVTTPTPAMIRMNEFRQYVNNAQMIDCNQTYIQNTTQQAETLGILAAGRAAVITA